VKKIIPKKVFIIQKEKRKFKDDETKAEVHLETSTNVGHDVEHHTSTQEEINDKETITKVNPIEKNVDVINNLVGLINSSNKIADSTWNFCEKNEENTYFNLLKYLRKDSLSQLRFLEETYFNHELLTLYKSISQMEHSISANNFEEFSKSVLKHDNK